MASAKSLAIRFYQLKCGHAPTGAYLKRFGHRENEVVRGNGVPNTGAPPPPLQSVEIPAVDALEEGGEGNELESELVPVSTGIGAVFHGDM